MRPLKILTWHTDGRYLANLSRAPHTFYLLSKPGRPPGYAGRHEQASWGPNVHDMPVDQVRQGQFDCIVFQDRSHFEKDQFEFLTASQRALPRIYLEHAPPSGHPTDERHVVDDPDVLLVHVSHFNALMWDGGRTPSLVIEHGVMVPEGIDWQGELDTGLVIVDDLARCGRRLGADIFAESRRRVALELAGSGARELGGLADIAPGRLPALAARYRYLFHPVRYASLNLSVLEAMMIGMPVVALATAEMSTIIDNGVSGFIDTHPCALVTHMQELARNRALASALGAQARRIARERFGIARFTADWDGALRHVTGTRRHSYGARQAA